VKDRDDDPSVEGKDDRLMEKEEEKSSGYLSDSEVDLQIWSPLESGRGKIRGKKRNSTKIPSRAAR